MRSDFMNRRMNDVGSLVGTIEGPALRLPEPCNLLPSVSASTFSDRAAKFVFVEQVYRALSIIQHTPY